ncbi:hypothetical protein LA345_39775 (plasmid) [Burkholderia vietnamiensis]|uniref:Uncharacterized protein n=1 Tax=Burkholderia vietnamiensis (strain G4 / LMG 22486) TaxID=269482 RepID=A4JUF2_BURVG|nr:hypothetical protein Bcep1808_7019 [Burkholderia vietnamiensis G4]MCB4349931.1 hypothetical protein [Burkholderia vietnamiensis]
MKSFVLHQPTSGRLVVRHADSGQVLLGVLCLPEAFAVEEGAAYVLMMAGGQVSVVDQKIDSGLPREVSGFGIDSYLRHACWRATSVPGTLAVRFLRAFGETGYVVFGPSQNAIVDEQLFNRSHAWFDVIDGELRSLDAPFDACGSACSQLLNSNVVWPDPSGTLHALPTHQSTWRPVYLQHALLMASLGAGEITEEAFIETVRADPRLFHIRSLSIDKEYAKYLARLRQLNGICEAGPKTADQYQRTMALAQQALRDTMPAMA